MGERILRKRLRLTPRLRARSLNLRSVKVRRVSSSTDSGGVVLQLSCSCRGGVEVEGRVRQAFLVELEISKQGPQTLIVSGFAFRGLPCEGVRCWGELPLAHSSCAL